MIFPEWVPHGLIEHYQKFYSNPILPHEQRNRELLLRLITDPDLKTAWKTLKKHRRTWSCDEHKPRAYGDDAMAVRLFDHIQYALERTEQEISTRDKEVRRYQSIAKAARELAGLIENSTLDKTPYRWFPQEAINTILETAIRPELINGYFSLAMDSSERHRKGGVYHPVKVNDFCGSEKEELWRVAENTKELFENHIMRPQYSVFSKILRALAADADGLAKESVHKPLLASHADTSRSTRFIRALYPDWLWEFGGPRYRTLAAFCGVVLDDKSISRKTVDDALKGFKLTGG